MAILIYLLYRNQSTLDIYIIVTGYYANLVSAFNDCMGFVESLKNNDISVSRLNEFLNYQDNVSQKFGELKLKKIETLSLDNISFQYNTRNKLILNQITCEFKTGKIFALTGENGVGKSTLLKIILGNLQPNHGQILLNDKNLYSYNYNDYINSISLVNQDPYFFHKSIMENLSYVCSNEKKIKEVCQQVGIHEFIMSLPLQYDTLLSEDAFNISGGQKQKLALARALLRNSKIILLDEFTSSMDITSVELIYQLLQTIKQDHIIIIITHKKNEVQMADIVYHLTKDGITQIS